MTQTAVIPDYLKPQWNALRLPARRISSMPAVWRNHDGHQPGANAKKGTGAGKGNDSGAWRAAFRAGGAVITES